MWRERLRSLGAAAILLSWLCADVVHATIFGPDDRAYVTPARGSAFSPVGLVGRGLLIERYATGTLIDDCDVLTSQHIFSSQASPVGGRLKFTAGLGTPDQMSSEGTVVAAGGRGKYPSTSERYEKVAHDWILVRLDKCLGARFGYAFLKAWPRGVNDLSHLQSLGYPIDRNRLKGLTLDPSCEARGVYALVWLNDCAALPGSSGGPLFRLSTSKDGKSHMEIYAMQTAGFGKGANTSFWAANANQATPVAMILPYIQRYLR